MKRREILKSFTILPLGGSVLHALGKPQSAPRTSLTPWNKNNNIYESIGATPLINARGTVTIIGASRVWPEVLEAMDAASQNYVQLDELMDKVGDRLAELTGAEWGFVSAGASAAVTAATAACVTGGDPDRLWQVPNLDGMKDEVVITNYSRTAYDAGAKAVGVKMVEVSTPEELELALGPQTAMVLVLAGARSEEGPLSIREIAKRTKPLNIPIFVDAAAEGLEVPNPHLTQGADLVAYSGGKYLRGPQCAGLLLGRKDLIQAARIAMAPHHGFGRGFKVGREEILGMLTAVEVWMKQDHDAIMQQWVAKLEQIAEPLKKIPGVTTAIRMPRGRSNHSPSLRVEWDMQQIPLTGYDMEQLLWNGSPRIAVSGAGSFLPFPPNMEPNISIGSSQFNEGDEKIVAQRVAEILKEPKPPKPVSTVAPAFDLSGQWDLEMHFSASVVNQQLVFEQQESNLNGTHFASFAARDLSGSLHGQEILFRSSYTKDGVRLNFEFTGTVTSDSEMGGDVSLGEYGMASWKAKRRDYKA